MFAYVGSAFPSELMTVHDMLSYKDIVMTVLDSGPIAGPGGLRAGIVRDFGG